MGPVTRRVGKKNGEGGPKRYENKKLVTVLGKVSSTQGEKGMEKYWEENHNPERTKQNIRTFTDRVGGKWGAKKKRRKIVLGMKTRRPGLKALKKDTTGRTLKKKKEKSNPEGVRGGKKAEGTSYLKEGQKKKLGGGVGRLVGEGREKYGLVFLSLRTEEA